MITIAASGATLRTNHYIHHKDTVQATTSLVSDGVDCCWCSCETVIPAFADLDNPDDTSKNDFFSWILKVPRNVTVTATLTNLDSGTDYVISDNTYGKFYDVDELKDNVWGFILDWQLVADLIGFGNYQMNISVQSGFSSNIIFDKDYPPFFLLPYSCQAAHNTVRIESHNSGYIEGGFDYRDIDITDNAGGVSAQKEPYWKQQIRWYGRFDITEHPVQTDNIYDNYRNLEQVQTQIEDGYNLRLEFIKTDISKQIIYDNLLADYLLISDYNANSVDTYRDVKVSLASIDNPQPLKNRTLLYNIKFVNYKQNRLKRHY